MSRDQRGALLGAPASVLSTTSPAGGATRVAKNLASRLGGRQGARRRRRTPRRPSSAPRDRTTAERASRGPPPGPRSRWGTSSRTRCGRVPGSTPRTDSGGLRAASVRPPSAVEAPGEISCCECSRPAFATDGDLHATAKSPGSVSERLQPFCQPGSRDARAVPAISGSVAFSAAGPRP